MTSYHHVIVETPPVLKERDGKWFVQIVHGDLTVEAPVGSWFATEFMVRIVIPQVFPTEGAPSAQIKPPVPPREG